MPNIPGDTDPVNIFVAQRRLPIMVKDERNTDSTIAIGDGPKLLLNVARRPSVMTRGLFDTEPLMAFCGDCKGKGFNLSKGPRASRKCPRCRGTGSFRVGNTKR